MAKQNILIVDADPESVKVLEVSLKKVGYSVTTARDGTAALEVLSFSTPDLVISDTQMAGLDGFALCTRLKENDEWAKIPFIFLTADKSIENKIRGLELGVDDYLNKPIFIREILVRVNLAIQRRQKERLERRGTKSKFSGNLQDMGVVDLLQTIDLGHKSGVLHILRLNDEGSIFFRDGQVIDAATRTRTGADAVYRMLVWSDGTFEIEFTNVDRAERIRMSTQGLLMEGMRRLDEWGRLQEQLPPLTAVFDVDEKMLAERLGEIPDEVNSVLKHFDSHATLLEVVDNGALGDLEALTLISKLYFEGLITEIHPTPSALDSGVDPNAFLPDPADSWVYSRPPANLPSRVVDDALGPHLSVAAQFAGLADTPTETPPFPAAAPPVAVPNAADTVLGMAALKPEIPPSSNTPTIPAAPVDRPPVETASEVTRTSDLPKRSTRTLTSRELPDSEKIAAAIDAELPPPEDTGEDEHSDSEPAYFDGKSYRASMGPRMSYDPEPYVASSVLEKRPSGVRLGVNNSDDATEGDAAPPVQEIDWPEDPPEIPGSRVPLIAVLTVLVVVAGAAAYWALGDSGADDKNGKAVAGQAAAASNNSMDVVPEKKADDKKADDKTADDKAAAVETTSLSPVGAETTDSAAPSVASAELQGVPAKPGDESPSVVVDDPGMPVETAVNLPLKKKQLTPEEMKAVASLMADVDNVGRRKKISLLRQALAIDPTNDGALASLAIQLLEIKQTRPEALALALQSVALNPDNAMGWMAKGYILQLDDKPDEAKDAYRKCAECSGPSEYTLECRRLTR